MSMIVFNLLAHEDKRSCLGQQVDDEILIQMMVNDEISDSQGIENDSILAGLYRFVSVLIYSIILLLIF